MSLSQTERNLWTAFLEEAIANRKYTAFAMRALAEGHPEVAEVFMEVAGSETVHALSHLQVAGEVRSTLKNLEAVIEGERGEAETMYPRMIREAEAEGRPDAVATFRLALERESRHLQLFEQAKALLEGKLAPYAVASPPPSPPPVGGPAESASALAEVDREKARMVALSRIREVIFGAQDGLISAVTLIAALWGAVVENNLIILAALAQAFAGMLSMGTGSYLSSKVQRDVHLAEIEKEARELEAHPGEEVAEMVAIYRHEGLSLQAAQEVVDHLLQDRRLFLRTMVEKELGLDPDVPADPTKDAAVMAASYLGGSFLPILPLFLLDGVAALGSSVGATLAGLFALGAVKARLIAKPLLRPGLEVVVVGAFAAIAGYFLGVLLPEFLGLKLPPG